MMKKILSFITAYFLVVALIPISSVSAISKISRSEVLKVGRVIPNAQLSRFGKSNIEINDLKGKIKIISIVPKLNTPVCDKQTHQFSEKNGGLDKSIDIITISTNSAKGQDIFAKKANISNLIFLSDNPDFNFGKNTGLLIEGMGMLKRTVLVVDANNIIRYIDFVPGGGLPDIRGALKAAKEVLLEKS
jgi:thioredoxin-dependent peroxiredoxin